MINFNYNDLNGEIWKSIINQILDIKTKRKHRKYTNIIYEEKELNGIIKYLTDKTGGNIHDNGTKDEIIVLGMLICHLRLSS